MNSTFSHRLHQEVSGALQAAGLAQPQFEARRLLQEAWADGAAQPTEQQLAKVREWQRQRCAGVPLAYLSGRRGFYKHEFFIKPGVLIPRPESEHVVEVALHRTRAIARHAFAPVRFLADLGCGSGCLGLSLLLEMPAAQLWALDASVEACAVTQQNAEHLTCSERTHVVHSTVAAWPWPNQLPMQSQQTLYGNLFDVVVANPPYIADGDPQVEVAVHKYEPHAALYAGSTGLEKLKDWSAWAAAALRSGGLFVTEVGASQVAAVFAIMEQLGFADIEIEHDLAGLERVVSGFKI